MEDTALIARTINNHLKSQNNFSQDQRFLYEAFRSTKKFTNDNKYVLILIPK